VSRDPDEVEIALGRLEHIIESIDAIQRFTAEHDRVSFQADEIVISAVIAKFTVIGEAARKMPAGIAAEFPNVEWRKAVNFRNFLVHVYDQINPAYLWQTIEDDLPTMKEELVKMESELS